jgi:WD40 repeat protein
MSLPADPRSITGLKAGQVEGGQASREASPAEEEVILATAGYDHCIKFWMAHTGKCVATLQHPDSQVNAMEISPDGQLLAACGYQHIRMFDVNNTKPNPVVNYEGKPDLRSF